MKRRQLVELEDLSWWPRLFRDYATDYLTTAVCVTKVYSQIVPRLAAAISEAGATRVIDLCSGGGGPWRDLMPALRASGVEVVLCLTDKYPNIDALGSLAATIPCVEFERESVSAASVPERLAGFRTMFTALHHFRPEEARAVLESAVRDRQGIAVAEGTTRTWIALLLMMPVPLAVWMLTPQVRPFRWSRLFWTYLLPVVPAAILFDGIVSCLRTYTPDEMLAMARDLDRDGYDWNAGIETHPGSPISTSYLVGVPRHGS